MALEFTNARHFKVNAKAAEAIAEEGFEVKTMPGCSRYPGDPSIEALPTLCLNSVSITYASP